MAFGQINFSHYPVLKNYVDAVERYEATRPLTKGKFKGLVPLGRRGDTSQFMRRSTDSIDIYVDCWGSGHQHPVLSFYRNGEMAIGVDNINRLSNKTSEIVAYITAHKYHLGWTYGDQPTLWVHGYTRVHASDSSVGGVVSEGGAVSVRSNYHLQPLPAKLYYPPIRSERWYFNNKGDCVNAGAGKNWVVDKDKKRLITKKYSDFFKHIKNATVLMQMEEGWAYGKTVPDEYSTNSAVKHNKHVIPKLANTNDYKLHSEFITNVLESWGQLGLVSKNPKVIATMLRNVIYKYHAKNFIKEVEIPQNPDRSSVANESPTETNDRYRKWLKAHGN